MKKILGLAAGGMILFLIFLPFYHNEETQELTAEVRANIDGEFVTLSQGITHYEVGGNPDNQTVLLVHGFSVPYYLWDPTFEALVDSGFHVIRYDIYGRGFSDRPAGKYDRAFFEQQILDLLEALNVNQPIHIAGVSMGGSIVAEFAENNPDKIDKIILIDPMQSAIDISVISKPFLGEYMMDVMLAPGMAESQLGDFYRPESYPNWPAKYREQMQYKGFKQALLSTMRNYATTDKIPTYKSLDFYRKPTLLIWGEHDMTFPIEMSNNIRDVLSVDFFPVAEAGHIPHYEKATLVNEKIISFLNE